MSALGGVIKKAGVDTTFDEELLTAPVVYRSHDEILKDLTDAYLDDAVKSMASAVDRAILGNVYTRTRKDRLHYSEYSTAVLNPPHIVKISVGNELCSFKAHDGHFEWTRQIPRIDPVHRGHLGALTTLPPVDGTIECRLSARLDWVHGERPWELLKSNGPFTLSVQVDDVMFEFDECYWSSLAYDDYSASFEMEFKCGGDNATETRLS